MKDDAALFLKESTSNWKESTELIDKLFSVAKPNAIFGEPVSANGNTVITASEVHVGMGVGYGSGGGEGFSPPGAEEKESEEVSEESEEAPSSSGYGSGYGGGGGGGGFSAGRPVAAIIIEPEGVRVEPIVDVTKLGLAFVTMLGSIFFMASRMARASKR